MSHWNTMINVGRKYRVYIGHEQSTSLMDVKFITSGDKVVDLTLIEKK